MKLAVLDAATLGADLDLSPLSEVGDCRVYARTAPAEVAARLADCEVAVVNKVRLNEATLATAASLRLICLAATGYDNVDLAYCRARGIAVCNVVGYSTASVTQVTVATVLSLLTHLPAYAEYVGSGRYSAAEAANCVTPPYHELAGKTWGIYGYGNIGRAVARVAEALGCRVLYARGRGDDRKAVSLDTLCRESDILTLHTPLTEATRGALDRVRLSLMKEGALLVNAARGAVTDEAAVAEAVLSGKLGGFGCDVYSSEPFTEAHPFFALLGHPNVCLTPHMAWGSVEARARCLSEIVANIRAFEAGDRRCRVD